MSACQGVYVPFRTKAPVHRMEEFLCNTNGHGFYLKIEENCCGVGGNEQFYQQIIDSSAVAGTSRRDASNHLGVD